MSIKKARSTRLGLEALEGRAMPAITSASLVGSDVWVACDGANDKVQINLVSTSVQVKDLFNNKVFAFDRSKVGIVHVNTGEGDNQVLNNISNLPLHAVGGDGNDWFFGSNMADSLYGGGGSDTLDGNGGNDLLYGNRGNDRIRGMDGNDTIYGNDDNDILTGGLGNDTMYGGDGADQITGGDGSDRLYGDAGVDSMIAIDGSKTDYVDGGDGQDGIWVDDMSYTPAQLLDSIGGSGGDRLNAVKIFANPADRSLDGDSVTDPFDGPYYKPFTANPLFADAGPSLDDIDQGNFGDCWLLSSLGAEAQRNPTHIRQMIADAGDGTFLVRLGTKFYRVDSELPTTSLGGIEAYAAGRGRQDSLWVALIEKAYAFHRTGGANHNYYTLTSGTAVEAFTAMGLTGVGFSKYYPNSPVNAYTAAIADKFSQGLSMVITMVSPAPGSQLAAIATTSHLYTLHDVLRDVNNNVTGIVLRNPWGDTGTNGNPYITLTPAELFGSLFDVTWANS